MRVESSRMGLGLFWKRSQRASLGLPLCEDTVFYGTEQDRSVL